MAAIYHCKGMHQITQVQPKLMSNSQMRAHTQTHADTANILGKMPYALTDYGAMVNGFAVIKEKRDYYCRSIHARIWLQVLKGKWYQTNFSSISNPAGKSWMD